MLFKCWPCWFAEVCFNLETSYCSDMGYLSSVTQRHYRQLPAYWCAQSSPALLAVLHHLSSSPESPRWAITDLAAAGPGDSVPVGACGVGGALMPHHSKEKQKTAGFEALWKDLRETVPQILPQSLRPCWLKPADLSLSQNRIQLPPLGCARRSTNNRNWSHSKSSYLLRRCTKYTRLS